MPVRAQPVTLPGPAGALEGLLELPPEPPAGIAVVCHPHPLHEGTMHNKVAHMLARGCNDLGLVTLRFNFRGVGASEGHYADGVGETGDARAALAWLADRYPGLPRWLCGFSFGAYVALRLAQDAVLDRLVTVAPPVGRLFDFAPLGPPDCPWLIVIGDADEVVDSAAVIAWARGLEPPPELIIMPGVGHFFHGNLAALREHLRSLTLG